MATFLGDFSVVFVSFHLWDLVSMYGDAPHLIPAKIWADFVV